MYQVYNHFTGCFLPTVFLEKKNNISLVNYIQELDSQLEKLIYSRIHKYIHKRTEHFFVVHSPSVHSPAEGSPLGHSPAGYSHMYNVFPTWHSPEVLPKWVTLVSSFLNKLFMMSKYENYKFSNNTCKLWDRQ